MRPRSSIDALAGSCVLAACGVVAWSALVVAYWPFVPDDTFITLRYSAHLAAGLGPTWNAGAAPIEGYTSPLWVVWLAMWTALGAAPLAAAKISSVLAMAASIGLGGALAFELSGQECSPRRDRTGARSADGRSIRGEPILRPASSAGRDLHERRLAAGLVVLVLGTFPTSAIHAVSGMETALATLLATGYALALLRAGDEPTPSRAALAAGLGLALSLTRPEMNLLVGVATLLAVSRASVAARSQLLTAVLALHVVPGALYFAWRADYYGELLPLPFYVKTSIPGATLAGLGEATAFVRSYFVQRIDLGLALTLGVVATWRRTTPMLGGALALFVFFTLPEHQMGYDFRYFHPIVPLLVAVAGVGLLELRRWVWPPAVPAIVVLAACLHTAPWLETSIAGKRAYGAGLERAHVPIGRALASIGGQLERPIVAALDCGAIAFHSRWTVIDTWGLNDPVIARAGRRDSAYVLAQHPEVIVVVSARNDRFEPHFEHERALWDDALAQGYEHVASFEFLPDYYLFTLARRGSAAAGALASRRH